MPWSGGTLLRPLRRRWWVFLQQRPPRCQQCGPHHSHFLSSRAAATGAFFTPGVKDTAPSAVLVSNIHVRQILSSQKTATFSCAQVHPSAFCATLCAPPPDFMHLHGSSTTLGSSTIQASSTIQRCLRLHSAFKGAFDPVTSRDHRRQCSTQVNHRMWDYGAQNAEAAVLSRIGEVVGFTQTCKHSQ